MKPVTVSKGAYAFCRYTIAGSLWLSIMLQSKILAAACFIVLLLSAILKIGKAPLIVLYSNTIDKILPSGKIVLEENAMSFAHTVGAVFSFTALIFLYFINPLTGWIITGILAVLKSSAAFGFCGAAKLYSCLNNPKGTCCRFGKRVKKLQRL